MYIISNSNRKSYVCLLNQNNSIDLLNLTDNFVSCDLNLGDPALVFVTTKSSGIRKATPCPFGSLGRLRTSRIEHLLYAGIRQVSLVLSRLAKLHFSVTVAKGDLFSSFPT